MDIQKYFVDLLNYNFDELEKYIIKLAKKNKIPYLNELKANFLETVVKLKSPKKSLEIGTGSGYSTYKILKALPENSQLISIDYNFYRINFFYEKVFLKIPDNLRNKLSIFPLESFYVINLFKNINEKFDFIFIDAMKKDYLKYLENIVSILNLNGVLIFDNITYNKQTINIQTKRSKNYIQGIRQVDNFNKQLINEKNFLTSFIPAGDGMSLSIKIQ